MKQEMHNNLSSCWRAQVACQCTCRVCKCTFIVIDWPGVHSLGMGDASSSANWIPSYISSSRSLIGMCCNDRRTAAAVWLMPLPKLSAMRWEYVCKYLCLVDISPAANSATRVHTMAPAGRCRGTPVERGCYVYMRIIVATVSIFPSLPNGGKVCVKDERIAVTRKLHAIAKDAALGEQKLTRISVIGVLFCRVCLAIFPVTLQRGMPMDQE